jgi:GGDEF domain-containing protein
MLDPIQTLKSRLVNAVDSSDKIQLLNDLAWELQFTDQEQARALSQDAFSLSTSGEFSETHLAHGVAASLRTLGYLSILDGNFPETLSQSSQALAALEDHPHPAIRIDILRNLCWSFALLGEYAQALDHGTEGLKLAYASNDVSREALMLETISNVYVLLSQPKQAIETYQKALDLYEKLEQKEGTAVVLNNMAVAYMNDGDYLKALEYALRGLQLARENRISNLLLDALATVGEIYQEKGDYREAESYLQQYLLKARESRSQLGEFRALLNLGKMYCLQQDDEPALFHLCQALNLSHEQVDHRDWITCHELLAELYQRKGNLEDALTHLKQSKALLELTFNEDTAKKLAGLQAVHQIESARREAEIYRIKNDELQNEIAERKKAQAIAEQLAITDPLTGLFNRRHFFYLAEREIARAIRYKKPLAVIMLDLDYFKQVNDTYGHSVGDQVLQAFAGRC